MEELFEYVIFCIVYPVIFQGLPEEVHYWQNNIVGKVSWPYY